VVMLIYLGLEITFAITPCSKSHSRSKA